MNWNSFIWVFPFTAGVIALLPAGFLWRFRSIPSNRNLMLLMLAVAEWSLAYAMEYKSATLAEKLWWVNIEYIGVVLTPPLWLLFALRYTGREYWLTTRNLLLLFVLPLLALIAVWTNDFHHLMWSHTWLDSKDGFPLVAYTRESFFWIFIVFCYGVLLTGTLFLLQTFVITRHIFRKQMAIILFGLMAPWLGNALYIFGWSPYINLDLTPFALTISGLAMTLVLFRFQLMDIVPVAREAVMEGIRDSVLVLDLQNRIVDMNSVAQKILRRDAKNVIGQSIRDILPASLQLGALLKENREGRAEAVWRDKHTTGHFDIRVTPLYERGGRSVGRLIILQDITERKARENVIWDREQRLRKQNNALLNLARHDLLRTLDLDAALREITEVAAATLEVTGACVWFLTEDRSKIRCIDRFEAHSATHSHGNELARNDCPAFFTALEEERTISTPNAFEDPRTREFAQCLEPESRLALLNAPIWVDGQMVGFANVERYSAIQEWTVEDENFIGSIADFVSLVYAASERRRAEDALKESEKKYRDLVENIDEMLYSIDRSETVIYVSPTCTTLLGFSPDELIGRPFTRFIHPEDLEEIQGNFLGVLNGRGNSSEFRIIRKDGGICWARSSSNPNYQENEIIGITGIISDVTDRKLAEEALKESEERYRTLIEESMDAVLVLDNGLIRFANRQAGEMFGHEPGAMIGLDMASLQPEGSPDDSPAGRSDASDRPSLREIKMRKKDGTWFDAEISSRSITLEGLPKTQVWIRDISQRLEAEAAARESDKRYLDLFNSMSDSIFFHGLDGLLLAANPSTLRILGLDSAEVGKVHLQDFMVPEFEHEFEDMYLKKLLEEKHAEGLLLLTGRDGQRKFFEYNNDLVEDRDGTPIVRGFGREITDRIMSRREMKNLQEQLLQSQKMQAVGTLASGIAHDFNNILQGISGYAQLVLDQNIPEGKKQDYMVAINNAVLRAADLVQRMLTFSRKVEPKLQSMDLNQEIIQAVKILERTIPRMIQIQTNLAADLRPVQADPHQIERVLINLGTNARDAMPEGGQLTIESRNITLDEAYCKTHLETTPGEYVLMTVTDTGRGMSKQVLDRIYEPFFTTKSVGAGTGLGLSSVYGIVTGHDGHITCYSEPDLGTTFKVYLPVMDRPEHPKVSGEPDGIRDLAGRETILVVDDEKPILESARAILEQFGYSVVTAAQGETAIEKYKQSGGAIDMIILDLNMPGMGGRACLKQLIDIDPDAKILISSGYTADGQVKEARAAGARAFLGKPYHLHELLTTIRDVLDRA